MYVPRRPRNGELAQMTLRLGALERLRRRDFLLDAELCFMSTSALCANESIGRRQSRSGFKRIRCKQRGNRAREEVRTELKVTDDGKCRQEQSAGYPSQPPTGQPAKTRRLRPETAVTQYARRGLASGETDP